MQYNLYWIIRTTVSSSFSNNSMDVSLISDEQRWQIIFTWGGRGVATSSVFEGRDDVWCWWVGLQRSGWSLGLGSYGSSSPWRNVIEPITQLTAWHPTTLEGYQVSLCVLFPIINNNYIALTLSNAELNTIRHFLALLVSHHILHVSRLKVKRRINSHPPSAVIIRSSPCSPLWQRKG